MWGKDRAGIDRAAEAVTEAMRGRLKATAGGKKAIPSRAAVSQGEAGLAEQFDPEYGGFGFNPANAKRPKFPEPVNMVFLLDQHRRGGPAGGQMPALKMVAFTLENISRGGIRDHLGGGYHRYATDRRWVVPHFEKMLYDNAQLASVLLAAFELTKDPRWRAEAEAIFGFVESKMTSPEGAFYSALDAETGGEEGAYYVWTREEVKTALGESADAPAFAKVYGLDGEPNAEGGHYVLREPHSRAEAAAGLTLSEVELEARLAPLRKRLLSVREKRPAPLRDDKVLCAWNGLMIAAYADGYRVLKDERYRKTAEKRRGVLAREAQDQGRTAVADLPGGQRQAAGVSRGLCLPGAWLVTAAPRDRRSAMAAQKRRRWSIEWSPISKTRRKAASSSPRSDHEQLLARAKDPFDNALPSGNSDGDSGPARGLSASRVRRPTWTGRAKRWRRSGLRSRRFRPRFR